MALWIARIETAFGAGYDEVLVSGRDERVVIQQVVDSPAFTDELLRSVTIRRIDTLYEREEEMKSREEVSA